MANGDMLDFTQALSELQMSEAELQNLIAKGELRAFRSGGTMKFRKADIDSLKNERATEPTIIIPAAGSGSALNTDVPQDLGVDESAATVVPDISPGGSAPTVNLGGGGQSGTEEIVFEDSDHRSWQRQARAIQRMHELRFRSLFFPITHRRTPRLEILEIRARTDLQPLAAASCPHLDVILDRRREAEIASTHLYHAVRNAQSAAHATDATHAATMAAANEERFISLPPYMAP